MNGCFRDNRQRGHEFVLKTADASELEIRRRDGGGTDDRVVHSPCIYSDIPVLSERSRDAKTHLPAVPLTPARNPVTAYSTLHHVNLSVLPQTRNISRHCSTSFTDCVTQ